MGQYYNPQISVNGLVFYLDFANTRSYSGSGITFRDLSFSGISATSINSPVYTTEAKGSFAFTQGTSRRIFASHGGFGITLNTSKSCFAWVKPSAIIRETPADRVVLFMNGTDINNRFLLAIGATDQFSGGFGERFLLYATHISDPSNTTPAGNIALSGAGYPVSTWYHMGCTYPGTGASPSLYINGIAITHQTSTLGFGFPATNIEGVNIGARGDATTFDFNGSIASVAIYNRALTPGEILKNYAAQKGRFGL